MIISIGDAPGSLTLAMWPDQCMTEKTAALQIRRTQTIHIANMNAAAAKSSAAIA